jgi:iron complex outermembrane receptor protein
MKTRDEQARRSIEWGKGHIAKPVGLGLLMALMVAAPAWPQEKAEDITNKSLEELMNIKVTSATKKVETLSGAPAAMFVVTSEDIQRGGFTSIPEALRAVPGLYVARINADWWSVSARGFSDYLNNKMLILTDGRSLYNPEFGGIEWDQNAIPMEEIERIEVIRGPGGTLWGANAINGVINIITKSSDRTQGIAVETSSSPEEGHTASIRYGGKVGEHVSYRMYGKAEYWYPGSRPSGGDSFDTWNMSQGGMRIDWNTSPKDTLTIDGRGYDGRIHDSMPFFSGPGVPQTLLLERFAARGGHILSRWHHTFSDSSSSDLLGYCDWAERTGPIHEARNSCDLEFQHDYRMSPRHSLIWGGSVFTTGSFKPPFFQTRMVPSARRDTTVSGFAQYEFDIAPDHFRIIGGSKFEHNPFTGFEFQPQIRGVWTPVKAHTLWAAISRGVRIPSEFERDEIFQLAQLPGAVPTYLTVVGDPKLKAETLRAYETGYRFQPASFFSLDAAIFYNDYGNLINLDLDHIGTHGAPIVNTNPVFVEIPAPWQNLGPGQTHGAEVYVRVDPVSRWRLAFAVTEVRGNSPHLGGSLNLPVANTVEHQFNIQSRLELTRHLGLDSTLFHYGGIPINQELIVAQNLRAHNRLDLGLSVHGISGLTFSVWGRDLGTDRHPENLPALFTTTGSFVRRSVVFNLFWESNSKQVDKNPRASTAPAPEPAKAPEN